MLIHPTVERLRTLGLTAMADAFVELQTTPEAADLPREDWLGLLIDREVTSRENRRLARRLREAKLRQAAVIEDTDFRTPRGLDRALFTKLATCQWIRDHQHLVIVGPTGTGKSWLACALGHKACRDGSPCSTGGRSACLPISPRRAPKAVCRGCSAPSSARGC
jgi:DNA replication protein DnaC